MKSVPQRLKRLTLGIQWLPSAAFARLCMHLNGTSPGEDPPSPLPTILAPARLYSVQNSR